MKFLKVALISFFTTFFLVGFILFSFSYLMDNGSTENKSSIGKHISDDETADLKKSTS